MKEALILHRCWFSLASRSPPSGTSWVSREETLLTAACFHPSKNRSVAGSNRVKEAACDSQEDDLAVDVGSEGEGRGEDLLAEQAVPPVQRRLLLVSQLLLPGGERLDVHELGASAQRVHPAAGCPMRKPEGRSLVW